MTDYTELIHDLRYCADRDRPDCSICGYESTDKCKDRIKLDAASAIEALQAEVDEANKSADAYRAMYFAKRGDITIEKVRELDEIDCHFHSSLIRLMYKRIEELDAQLPKRGEWIHNTSVYGTTTGGLTVEHHYTCSVCGGLMGRKGDKFCYNCGAKMELQE